jgi:DNA replication protein DnaC
MATLFTDLPKRIRELRRKYPPVTPARLEEWRWQNEILPHLKASQLPPRFWYKAVRWKKEQRTTFNQVREMLTCKGVIVALIGPRGVGKTTIAAQLIIDRAMNDGLLPWHRRPPYRKLSALIARFKAIYADFGSIDSERLLERHNSLCRDHPLVVIDELHDCDDQRIKNRLLTDTIDKRYGNLVDTVLISNQSPAEFAETTSDSVLSRLKEHGRIVHCTWESWR